MKGLAIISVYDKSNLEEFAKSLSDLGYEILSTGGTARFLREKNIPVRSISEYTSHPEILEGRVKSLHPRIHGGILARRDRPEDLEDIANNKIDPIDFVVVNLYPFTKQVGKVEAEKDPLHSSLVEDIDIGGPTMIRAAAKNCRFVVPVCDPNDYDRVLDELKANGEISLKFRLELASKVFAVMAEYDGAIARYFSLGEKLLEENGEKKTFAPFEFVALKQKAKFRYGENPHQKGALYEELKFGDSKSLLWQQLQGKELSYNNLLDMSAALDLVLDISCDLDSKFAAVAIKHSNPCGVAVKNSVYDAFISARACDPISIFGGIIAVSGQLDEKTALAICEGFVEIVIADDISSEAIKVFSQKKNLRLIRADYAKYREISKKSRVSIRSCYCDYLLQDIDNRLTMDDGWTLVCGEVSSAQKLNDYRLAWKVCKHVKSNAIVIVKDECVIGVGAGQMSRLDSARIAIERAQAHGHSIQGSVAASDAFLPFPDTLEILHHGGVTGLVQPGGSVKDEVVIDSARMRGVTMFFAGERHFRH